MDIFAAYRFYKDQSLLAANQTNRDDANKPVPFYVDNNTIPAFQISIPYVIGSITLDVVLIDMNGDETDITADVTLFEDIRLYDGVAMRYISHGLESVTYDAGCYYMEIRITGGDTFYGVLMQNLESDYVETWHRLINATDKRLVNATDKRKTK